MYLPILKIQHRGFTDQTLDYLKRGQFFSLKVHLQLVQFYIIVVNHDNVNISRRLCGIQTLSICQGLIILSRSILSWGQFPHQIAQVLQAEALGAVDVVDKTPGCRNKNVDFTVKRPASAAPIPARGFRAVTFHKPTIKSLIWVLQAPKAVKMTASLHPIRS
jgi:hypothetical protein